MRVQNISIHDVLQLLLRKLCSSYLYIFISGANPLAIGEFENHKHDGTSIKNNWHYVTITYDPIAETYTWKNKANRKWSLYPTEDESILRVGRDCPYYDETSYSKAAVTTEGIIGPHNVLYARE